MKIRDRGWRDWYQLERWRKLRRHQLRVEPLCAMCLVKGIATPATIADHVEHHGGDWNRFILGRLQSLCEHCHNSSKRFIEQKGYLPDVGADGWPLDPRHPVFNQS
jgi:5-methylcytosine-specific restriction endonuclease McrA